jgi:hypothetical protein
MKYTTLIGIVLGVLVLISVVQALQLTGLKGKLSEGGVSVKASTGSTVATSGDSAPKRTQAVPKSLQDLPTMVGGC